MKGSLVEVNMFSARREAKKLFSHLFMH